MIESARAIARTSSRLQFPAISGALRTGYPIVCIRFFAAGLALATQIALARRLGETNFGQYAYVAAWLQLMLVIADGGFATAALRYLAEYEARQQPGRLRGFLTRSTQISVGLSLLLALFMAGFALVCHGKNSDYSATCFLVASTTLPFMSYVVLNSAVIRGLGHVVPSLLTTLVQPFFLLGALVVIPNLVPENFTTVEALLLNLGGALLAVGVVVHIRKRNVATLGSDIGGEFLTREWLSTATVMLAASSLMYLQGRTGVIFSGLLLDARATGAYATVERFSDVALFGLISINLLAAPKFAALHAQGRQQDLRRWARLSACGASGFMLLAGVPLVLFGKQILRLFGEDFVSAYPALLILLAGTLVNALCGSVGFLLSMTGHQRDTVSIALVSLCLNLALSVLLIPAYGIEGTAIANAVSMVAWNLSMLCCVRWRLGIWACVGRDR